jgi:hypothetical protein
MADYSIRGLGCLGIATLNHKVKLFAHAIRSAVNTQWSATNGPADKPPQ